MAEKPLVYCSKAINVEESFSDPLKLKQSVNTLLETTATRGTSSNFGFVDGETIVISGADVMR
jgi:hypothetical protein